MATRLHNFSYKGTNGTLTFVPCTGAEEVCKVYIKVISASVQPGTYDPLGLGSTAITSPSVTIKLNTLAPDNTTELQRAFISFETDRTDIGLDNKQYSATLNGSCSVSEVIGVGTGKTTYPDLRPSSVGYPAKAGTFTTTWHVPEYIYLKKNDVLKLTGFTGTFFIELMAISES